ncbi:hypothetical protein E5288_WYG016143 [Bos mutus]|uniref:Uncharacterized protein n=1 Tax=Bos mutus TaxID=72004 RepID=A0A6B0RPQ5_9CETA|nr:hypothetical protein [Bos mutus]
MSNRLKQLSMSPASSATPPFQTRSQGKLMVFSSSATHRKTLAITLKAIMDHAHKDPSYQQHRDLDNGLQAGHFKSVQLPATDKQLHLGDWRIDNSEVRSWARLKGEKQNLDAAMSRI